MGLVMPDASAIASMEAPWKPRAANALSAASSICFSRTGRGTRRLPSVCEVTVRDGAIADILPSVTLLAVISGGTTDAEDHLFDLRGNAARAHRAGDRRGPRGREGRPGRGRRDRRGDPRDRDGD